MIVSFKKILFLSLSSLWVSAANAEPRDVYDTDHDGLIEIYDLQDFNDIRNNIAGQAYTIDNSIQKNGEILGETLYGSSSGCPEAGCNGYELMADLDFDTNNNGLFDEGDTFWNDGEGWDPIGHFRLKFNAEFHGNGKTISNVTLRRPEESFQGLFSYSELAFFHDLSLVIDMTALKESGGLLGYGWKVKFENINLDVTSYNAFNSNCQGLCSVHSIGGVVGAADETYFHQVFVKADLSGEQAIGGVAGSIANSTFDEVAVTGVLRGVFNLGGVVGRDTSGQYKNVVSIVDIQGRTMLGAMVGGADKLTAQNILLSGFVHTGVGSPGGSFAGGMMGDYNPVRDENSLSRIISTVKLSGVEENEPHYIGGLIGRADASVKFAQAYWARDLAGSEVMVSGNSATTKQYFDLVDLQCASDTNRCNGLMFPAFNESQNAKDMPLWMFGSNTEAPSMQLSTYTFGDIDGNGVADSWPDIVMPVIDNPDTGNPDDGKTGNEKGSSSGGALYFLLLLAFLVRGRPPVNKRN